MNNLKRRSRGISQPLCERIQRVRTSRHGKPHTIRVRHIGVVEMKDDENGVVKVTYTNETVTQPYKLKVAAASTGTWGKVNDGGPSAGHKHPKQGK